MFSFTFNWVSVFFYGFKSQLSNSYDNWYVQKYLKGIFHKGMLLIWKKYFTRAILSFSRSRYAIIARLNVIYTKLRRAMIIQLNKICRAWACAPAIARHLRPGLPPLFSRFPPFQDVPTFHRFIKKKKLNNSCSQFVYNFYPPGVLVLEQCLQKW